MPDPRTARVLRAAACASVALTVAAAPAIGQCANGSPPPCSRPTQPKPNTPRAGTATIRVVTSTPVSGTTLKWQDLEKGVPLHVVVEHAVQRTPPGQVPVLVAYANLTPDATQKGYQRVLQARVITPRPTQRALDLLLTRDDIRQQRITIAIHVAFSTAADTATVATKGWKLSYEWGSSITLEFPVDSTGAPGTAQSQTPRP